MNISKPISVEKRLPPAEPGHWSCNVLVWAGTEWTIDSYYHAEDGDGFWMHHRAPVEARPTHWMPLPPPPVAPRGKITSPVGVHLSTHTKPSGRYSSWVATWWDAEKRKQRRKMFSCQKYGWEQARRLAIQHRLRMIQGEPKEEQA